MDYNFNGENLSYSVEIVFSNPKYNLINTIVQLNNDDYIRNIILNIKKVLNNEIPKYSRMINYTYIVVNKDKTIIGENIDGNNELSVDTTFLLKVFEDYIVELDKKLSVFNDNSENSVKTI